MNKKLVSLILTGVLTLSVSTGVFASQENHYECKENTIGDNKVVGSEVEIIADLSNIPEDGELIKGKEYFVKFICESKGSLTDTIKHYHGLDDIEINGFTDKDGLKKYQAIAKIDTSSIGNIDVAYQLYMQSGNNGKKVNYHVTELKEYTFNVVEEAEQDKANQGNIHVQLNKNGNDKIRVELYDANRDLIDYNESNKESQFKGLKFGKYYVKATYNNVMKYQEVEVCRNGNQNEFKVTLDWN